MSLPNRLPQEPSGRRVLKIQSLSASPCKHRTPHLITLLIHLPLTALFPDCGALGGLCLLYISAVQTWLAVLLGEIG